MNPLQPKKPYSRSYLSAFHDYARGTVAPSATLYEGQDAAGNGYVIVTTTVDGQIVPLAEESGAVRRLASVIPTTTDVRFNIITAPGSAAMKPQGTPFTGAPPTVTGSQFTLSAFTAGTPSQLSIEVVQDLPSFLSALSVELVPQQNAYEENLFVNGTGVNEPQGMIGNVGAGITAAPDSAGNLVSLEATDEVLDTLPSMYHQGAAWLMRRATARSIRRAQRQQGLVDRVWTRENGQDYLHGYPVEFSDAMPAAAPGATPVLFGDFKAGYIIGDRGGSQVFLKLLDQTSALLGLIDVLTYRRCDGRVRRSEAIQQLTCAPA